MQNRQRAVMRLEAWSALGSPTNLLYRDWKFEGQYQSAGNGNVGNNPVSDGGAARREPPLHHITSRP
jgi:hypothetical protein